MNKLKNWIKDHQVAAFFIIAFAITWGVGAPYDALLNDGQYLWLPVIFLAFTGPGLAGIIISAITNTQPVQRSRKAFWIAFFMAWATGIVVCLANLHFIENVPLSPMIVGLIAVAVLPVAFVIASAYSHNPGVRRYLASLVQVRGVWGWMLLALVMFPALFLMCYPLNQLIYKQPIPTGQLPEVSLSLIGLVVVKFFYQLMFFNATGEEAGWRGYAMPRLQARTSPLLSGVMIGFLWAMWHFFGWKAEGLPVSDAGFWLDMFAGHILLSILIVWICNRANGSILVAGIAHAALNTVQAFVPNWGPLLLVLSVTAVVVILVDRMWQKLPLNHPAVYQSPQPDEPHTELDQPLAERSPV